MADIQISRPAILGNGKRGSHGLTAGGHPPAEYNSWKGMRHRCHRPSHPRYSLYGGRGIRVCGRWFSSFEAFLTDMGPKPSPAHSLDRIDVNGHYEPGNVRWAEQKEQCRNQRRNRLVSFQGVEMTLAEAAERSGVDASHMGYHLRRGRDADDAVAAILGNRRDGVCVNGHALVGDNLYTSPRGKPQCRTCRKAARLRSRAKKEASS